MTADDMKVFAAPNARVKDIFWCNPEFGRKMIKESSLANVLVHSLQCISEMFYEMKGRLL